jgi:xylulokinase
VSGKYIIASDSGGSGTKSIIFDLEGREIAKAFRAIGVYHPELDSTVQYPDEMLSTVIETVKECLDVSKIKANEVEALVFDGQQAGIIWIDENYDSISPFDSWLDNRYGYYSKIMFDICGEKILKKTGTPNGTTGPKILWWKNNHREIFDKACKMVIPSSYIGGKLAGSEKIHKSGFSTFIIPNYYN